MQEVLTMRYPAILTIALLTACGGAGAPSTADNPTKVVTDNAIDIVHNSFLQMGGVERLRLRAGKLLIRSAVSAQNSSFPVDVIIGGPGRWRLDYSESDITYVYDGGTCRKVAYGVPARCTPDEEIWHDVTILINELIYPSRSATNIRASFKTREPETIDGVSCDVIEVRPKNTNLRLRAAYSQSSGLLIRTSFSLLGADGSKHSYNMTFGDWREIKGVKIPFSRQVSSTGNVIWLETVEMADFDLYDERSFELPPPPTTAQPLTGTIPERRIVTTKFKGQTVEIPAPFPTVGGGPILDISPTVSPAAETMNMLIKGKIESAVRVKDSLQSGVVSGGREVADEPGIILLEKPSTPDDEILMIVYIPLKPKID
jgi:hypothetical protein